MKTQLFSILLWLGVSMTIFSQDVDYSFYDTSLPIEDRAEILVSQMTLEEKISQLTNSSAGIPRLNILPYDWWNEALHGVARNGKATIFPQGIAVGATFDPDLAYKMADAISTEGRAKFKISQEKGNYSKFAGLTFWTPNVNIFRDPRWGRGQETYGEDPFLMSKIGVAFVKGLQGNDEKYLKAAACAKHFAVHSGPEKDRHHFNAEPNMQDFYETYMPAFEALVNEAKVEGVMAAYNAVFGDPSCSNKFLLQDLVREKWGFDGYIVSDCGAVNGVWEKHKKAETPQGGAALALNAGVDLNCGDTYRYLPKAVEEGLVSEEIIHKRTVQLYKTRFRLGLLDGKDSANPYSNISGDKIHCQEHIDLAREVAQKSIVLLKNKNNILPLSKDIKIPYLTGPFANSSDMLMGSYYGVSPSLVTILEGITDRLNPGTSLNYRSGALPFQKNINPKNWAPFVASESDVTICVVGLTADFEGEEVDAIASGNVGDKIDLKLPQNQIDYVKEIQERKGDSPFVLVIASGSPVSLEGIEEKCDAILQIWYPGEQGGNAVADVIFGDVSPSGHLPITFPKNIEQLPPYEDYSMQGRTYKYMKEEPMFPFGFGLTYSKTEIADLQLKSTKLKKGSDLVAIVKVSNTGEYDIDEVVQLYVCPKDVNGGIPLKSLKAFKRLALKKGETKEISFTVDSADLLIVDENGKKVWRKGEYKIVVGNSSPGELSTKLGAAVPQEKSIYLK